MGIVEFSLVTGKKVKTDDLCTMERVRRLEKAEIIFRILREGKIRLKQSKLIFFLFFSASFSSGDV